MDCIIPIEPPKLKVLWWKYLEVGNYWCKINKKVKDVMCIMAMDVKFLKAIYVMLTCTSMDIWSTFNLV